MAEVDYDHCPARSEIENLKHWQAAQNGHLRNIDTCLGDLVKAESRRAGGEAMLKWILGFVGLGTLASVIGLLLQLAGVVG